jgi:hypothetical protein
MTTPDDARGERDARTLLGAILIALIAAGVAFRALVLHNLNHTSLVFMGIPAIIAIAMLFVRPKTAIGTVNKVILIALCLSGAVFGEALVCILLSTPIFLLVGTLIGAVINWIRSWDSPEPPSSPRWRAALGLALLPFGAEGVVPGWEFNREEQISFTQVVNATPSDVRAALAGTPDFDRRLPRFFRMGFPKPAHAMGSGIDIGDRRTVMFLHGEHHSGALVMQVSAVDSSSVTFTTASDSSYITHWLTWHGSKVQWHAVAPGQTAVTWTLSYRRRLDPAWYFVPLERYGARLAARYLIETAATPR